MKIQHTTLLSAALLSAAVLVAAPAAGAKAKKKPEPDLALQRITISPHFLVVKPDGKPTSPITVKLSIRNIGHAPAPASVTLVKLFQGTHTVARVEIPQAGLAAGHAVTPKVIFHDAEPTLGLLRAAGQADHNNEVPGTALENNFKSTPDIPVIAQRWTGVMEADVVTPSIFGPIETDRVTTPRELLFRFSRLDGIRFVYAVGGAVDQRATFNGNGCSGEGDGMATMARWGGDSGLSISRDLKQYEATVRASLGSPFKVTVTCPNQPTPGPTTVKLKDLLTKTSSNPGTQPMKPSARVLSDEGTFGDVITITNSWKLTADVP